MKPSQHPDEATGAIQLSQTQFRLNPIGTTEDAAASGLGQRVRQSGDDDGE